MHNERNGKIRPMAPPVKPTTVVDRSSMMDISRLHGQCDPVRDRELLKREFGLTDDEISQIRPAVKAADDDDPWFNSNPEEFTGNEFASEGH